MVKRRRGKECRFVMRNRRSRCDDAIICHDRVKLFLVSQMCRDCDVDDFDIWRCGFDTINIKAPYFRFLRYRW